MSARQTTSAAWRAFDAAERTAAIEEEGVDVIVATSDRKLASDILDELSRTGMTIRLAWDRSTLLAEAERERPYVVVLDVGDTERAHALELVPALQSGSEAAVVVVVRKRSRRFDGFAAHACAYDVVEHGDLTGLCESVTVAIRAGIAGVPVTSKNCDRKAVH